MQKKKIILAAVTMLSVFTLAACSGDSSKEIASMKGGKITVNDFYEDVKKSSASQQAFQNMVVFKVLENNYGKDVTKEDVNKEYKKRQKEYGSEDQFKQALAQSNLTESDFKNQLKKSMTLDKALDSNIKVTDADLKKEWKTFHPTVEAQIISMEKEEDIKKVADELKKGGDFTKIAKEKSIDATAEKGGKIKFDSAAQTLPEEVKTAAFKLKDGEMSDVVTSTTSNGYGQSTQYYLVKMTKTKAKGHDWKPYKKDLTKIYKESKMNDQTFVTETITKELKSANVKVKDEDMKNAMAGLLPEEAKKDSKKDDSSKSKESDKKDDKKEDNKK